MAFEVVAYLEAGIKHAFPAADREKGREIASRIIREGLWVLDDKGDDVFHPVHRVFKVTVKEVPSVK